MRDLLIVLHRLSWKVFCESFITALVSNPKEVISQHGRPACASAFAAFDDSSFTSTASTVTGCVLHLFATDTQTPPVA